MLQFGILDVRGTSLQCKRLKNGAFYENIWLCIFNFYFSTSIATVNHLVNSLSDLELIELDLHVMNFQTRSSRKLNLVQKNNSILYFQLVSSCRITLLHWLWLPEHSGIGARVYPNPCRSLCFTVVSRQKRADRGDRATRVCTHTQPNDNATTRAGSTFASSCWPDISNFLAGHWRARRTGFARARAARCFFPPPKNHPQPVYVLAQPPLDLFHGQSLPEYEDPFEHDRNCIECIFVGELESFIKIKNVATLRYKVSGLLEHVFLTDRKERESTGPLCTTKINNFIIWIIFFVSLSFLWFSVWNNFKNQRDIFYFKWLGIFSNSTPFSADINTLPSKHANEMYRVAVGCTILKICPSVFIRLS